MFGFAGGIKTAALGIGGLLPMLLLLGGGFYMLNQQMHKKGSPEFYKLFGYMASGLGSLAAMTTKATSGLKNLSNVAATMDFGRAINNIDTKKLSAFAGSIGHVSDKLRALAKSKDVVVEMTALTKASKEAGLSAAASGARASSVGAHAGAAVAAARQSVLPPGGGAGRLPPGVLVTDSINVAIPGYKFSEAVGVAFDQEVNRRSRHAKLGIT
jgi:hypothetical protein